MSANGAMAASLFRNVPLVSRVATMERKAMIASRRLFIFRQRAGATGDFGCAGFRTLLTFHGRVVACEPVAEDSGSFSAQAGA
jgi:hypothetical protein